jgi:hypothetical protein
VPATHAAIWRVPRNGAKAFQSASCRRWHSPNPVAGSAGWGRRSWPWTVTSFDESYYLESKEAAIAKVRELKARGRSNIDVGCMQINLGHHGHAFATLEQALDPAQNVAYGAGFLRRLHGETLSWASATAHYHSRDPARGDAYRAKVFRLWHGVSSDGPAIGTVQLAGAGRAQEPPDGARILHFGKDRSSARGATDAIPVLRGR